MTHYRLFAECTGDATTAISSVLRIAVAGKVDIQLALPEGINITVRHTSDCMDLLEIYRLQKNKK